MTLADELMREVRPFYDGILPGRQSKPMYPPDRNGERFCGTCKDWKIVKKFRKRHPVGHQRDCLICENKARNMRMKIQRQDEANLTKEQP